MSNNAIIKIKDLMAADLFSDLTITCGDESFKVHKSILWIQSEYFRKLLGGKFKEANATTLDLSADDPAVLTALIHYFYNFTLQTDAGTGSSSNTSIFNNSATNPPFLVHVYAIADKYDVPPLRALAEQRLRKIYKPETPIATTAIEDFVATIREVEECTPDKLESGNGLWGVVLPAMRANMGVLLRHEEVRELLLDMSELNFHLLAGVGPAQSVASKYPNTAVVNLADSEEEGDDDGEGDEDGFGYDGYGSRRAGGRLTAARYGQGRRLG